MKDQFVRLIIPPILTINQTFHSLNGELLAMTNINYIIDDVESKPYIVITSRCFSGGFAQACYNLEDITAATQQNDGELILDENRTNPPRIKDESLPKCSYTENGNTYAYTVQIYVSNPYTNGGGQGWIKVRPTMSTT